MKVVDIRRKTLGAGESSIYSAYTLVEEFYGTSMFKRIANKTLYKIDSISYDYFLLDIIDPLY